jgi:hypothetical protein
MAAEVVVTFVEPCQRVRLAIEVREGDLGWSMWVAGIEGTATTAVEVLASRARHGRSHACRSRRSRAAPAVEVAVETPRVVMFVALLIMRVEPAAVALPVT